MNSENNSSLTKTCSKCGKDKSLEDFSLEKRNKTNGRKSYCRDCGNLISKAYRAKDPEKRQAQINKSREKHREAYKETKLVKGKESYAKHKNKINAKKRARRINDPVWAQKRKEQLDNWRAANPDKVKKHRVRRITNTTLGGNTALESYIEVLLNDPCSYCGEPSETIDHIVPLSKGGKHEITNITGACKSCNSAKHNKDLFIFLVERAHDIAGTNCYITN